MGKRGPKPKSPEIKRLEGNPGKRKIVDVPPEVDLSASKLVKPAGMLPNESAIWDDVLAAFPSWYFTAADAHLLELYCETKCRIDRMKKRLENVGLMTKRGTGALCANPLIKEIRDETRMLAKLSADLGLTRERRKGIAQGDPERVPAEAESSSPDGSDHGDIGNLIAPVAFGRKG